MKQVIAIKEMSAGNETVGEMWKETKIFNADEPIDNIIKWAQDESEYEEQMYTRKNIVITVPHK